MSARFRMILCFWACGCSGLALAFFQAEAVPVEPSELARRDDLVGKDVSVDDHVAFYVARTGIDADELQLKRTPVTFLVPRRLRPQNSRRMTSVIVRGVLKREGGRLVCDVTSVESVPNDIERLDRGIASLAPKDYESRKAWARWAERRAKEFKDEALQKRARALEAVALRLEADMKRLGVDAPGEWLSMAQDARRRRVPEPEPSALGHRALRAKLAAASDRALLKSVIDEIQAFFPSAAGDRDSGRVNLARWEASYADDPAGTYRKAPPEVRKGLDRRLWADATERFLDLQVSADIQAALELAAKAETALPEKKELAGRLIEKAVRQARQALGSLRQSEVKALAGVLRDKLGQPAEALGVLRDWLNIQQSRLSDTDAEGLLLLANLHDELLQDRVTALALLRKAWRIDPSSKEIAQAFRTRGFRKVQNDWVEAAPGAYSDSEPGSAKSAPPAPGHSQGLRGLTPEELSQRLGAKPDRVNYMASKGQLVEQWIYYLDTKQVRYVNLLRTPGELKPRVVADYTLPGTRVKGGLTRVR